MLRKVLGVAALTLCLACPSGGDLVVPPPVKVHPSFTVDIPPPRDDGRLPDTVGPLGYRLELAIDPAADQFEGEVLIDVEVRTPTSAIVLHGAGLDIDRAQVVVGDKRIAAEASYRKAAGAEHQDEELVLVTTSEVPAGEAQIHLFYRAPLGTALRGIYRVEEGGASYVFTQFEPSDARRMFPCFDDPVYKVPFEVAVTAPADASVFTNTPETGVSDLADGRRRHTFAKSERLPTYLVALAVGPFEVLEGPKAPVPLRVIAAKGKAKLGKAALEIAQAELDLLRDYFGEPYPYAKLDLVAVPNFGPGAMENAGLITFREELLLLDPKTASAKTRRDVALVVAHELAHQWFGNLVTMKWWDDLWLNEGFATFMESEIVGRYQPTLGVDLEMLSLSGWVMDFDALPSARRVRQPVSHTYEAEEAFDGITYVKGASVIRMLERWVGTEPFREGVRAYLTAHRWGGATAADMFAALSQASGKDVAAVATTFLDQPGVPLVGAELRCDDEGVRVLLSQRQYRGRPGADPGGRRWSIPVCVAYGGRTSGRHCTLLDSETATLPLETACPRWILPNAEYAGYYRYALAPDALTALGKAAREGSAVDKVGYLSNLWALVQAGEVPAATLLDVLRDYERERDRAVIEETIKIFEHVGDALVDEATQPKFRELVAKLLMPTARRLGWDPRPGESEDDRLLRRAVLEALATLTDDPWMAAEAKKRALAYLTDPGAIDADVAAIALRLAAHRGDVAFAALDAARKAAQTPAQRVALVQALGSFGDPATLRQTLALVGDGTIRAQDALYVARAAVAWPTSRRVFIAWLKDNLPSLAERIPGFGLARMVASLRRICDPDERAAAEASFTPHLPKIGSERRFREALEHADMCIDLRARQAEAVSAYFKKGRR